MEARLRAWGPVRTGKNGLVHLQTWGWAAWRKGFNASVHDTGLFHRGDQLALNDLAEAATVPVSNSLAIISWLIPVLAIALCSVSRNPGSFMSS